MLDMPDARRTPHTATELHPAASISPGAKAQNRYRYRYSKNMYMYRAVQCSTDAAGDRAGTPGRRTGRLNGSGHSGLEGRRGGRGRAVGWLAGLKGNETGRPWVDTLLKGTRDEDEWLTGWRVLR